MQPVIGRKTGTGILNDRSTGAPGSSRSIRLRTMINTPKKVTLFVQCLVDGLYPEVGEAVVKIFRKLNLAVDCPADQTCCGQIAFNSGYRQEARVAAERFIRIFEKAEVVVCPSGSCVHMVRRYYPDLFRDSPAWRKRAEAVGDKTFELTQFLVDVMGVEDHGARYDGRITLHDSCQALRNLGIRAQPRRLIAKVAGLEFVEMKDSERCCGFGGSFSVKYPEISTAMVDDKVHNIIATGADAVTGVDISCLMNIQGRLSRMNSPVRVLHIAQLLAGC
ncbi:MAG: (Fe-S)-binding protein [Desulfobacterales bacterium]